MVGLLLILASFASLLAISTGAAPQPKAAPGWSQLKQTSRREVLERLQNPPQRRTSPVPYPPCANASPSFNAAVYPGIFTSSNEPADYITNTPAPTFDACIQLCVNTPTCASGDWRDLPGNNCYLIKDPAPPLSYTNGGYSAFVLNTDCSAFASKAPAGASCCNY